MSIFIRVLQAWMATGRKSKFFFFFLLLRRTVIFHGSIFSADNILKTGQVR